MSCQDQFRHVSMQLSTDSIFRMSLLWSRMVISKPIKQLCCKVQRLVHGMILTLIVQSPPGTFVERSSPFCHTKFTNTTIFFHFSVINNVNFMCSGLFQFSCEAYLGLDISLLRDECDLQTNWNYIDMILGVCIFDCCLFLFFCCTVYFCFVSVT